MPGGTRRLCPLPLLCRTCPALALPGLQPSPAGLQTRRRPGWPCAFSCPAFPPSDRRTSLDASVSVAGVQGPFSPCPRRTPWTQMEPLRTGLPGPLGLSCWGRAGGSANGQTPGVSQKRWAQLSPADASSAVRASGQTLRSWQRCLRPWALRVEPSCFLRPVAGCLGGASGFPRAPRSLAMTCLP